MFFFLRLDSFHQQNVCMFGLFFVGFFFYFSLFAHCNCVKKQISKLMNSIWTFFNAFTLCIPNERMMFRSFGLPVKANKIKLNFSHSHKTKRLSKFSAIITRMISIDGQRKCKQERERERDKKQHLHHPPVSIQSINIYRWCEECKMHTAYVWKIFEWTELKSIESMNEMWRKKKWWKRIETFVDTMSWIRYCRIECLFFVLQSIAQWLNVVDNRQRWRGPRQFYFLFKIAKNCLSQWIAK